MPGSTIDFVTASAAKPEPEEQARLAKSTVESACGTPKEPQRLLGKGEPVLPEGLGPAASGLRGQLFAL